eukprot:maker-scaffold68_size422247-snap-gene-3.21 protein:Tk11400 transcript:maker-scaffold68_size422247-snap-gene-3.21-mRNA-1 annotation:"hypothetical protein GUITHDRAFT_74010"
MKVHKDRAEDKYLACRGKYDEALSAVGPPDQSAAVQYGLLESEWLELSGIVAQALAMSSAPNEPEALDAEPLDAEPLDAEPLDAEPLDAEPLDAEPLDAEPLDAEPLDAEPLDAEPLDAEPLDAEPLDAEPLDAEPLDAEAGGRVAVGCEAVGREAVGLTQGCGTTTSENCTYFESDGTSSGICTLKVCRCNDSICQLRLDFDTFMISGPSTSTEIVAGTFFGQALSSLFGADQASASQCLTDSFSATNPGGSLPPTICGMNTGEHSKEFQSRQKAELLRGIAFLVYLDASECCNDLTFMLGSEGNAGSLVNRQWSIKVPKSPHFIPPSSRVSLPNDGIVMSCARSDYFLRFIDGHNGVGAITQYSCDYENLAPKGCTQYFFDTDGVDTVQTYNFQGGAHLASQNQNICVR